MRDERFDGRAGWHGAAVRSPQLKLGRALSTKTGAVLESQSPFAEVEELRQLVAQGQERGFLTFDEIATAMEEVELSKEELADFHGWLQGNGIDVVGADIGRA